MPHAADAHRAAAEPVLPLQHRPERHPQPSPPLARRTNLRRRPLAAGLRALWVGRPAQPVGLGLGGAALRAHGQRPAAAAEDLPPVGGDADVVTVVVGLEGGAVVGDEQQLRERHHAEQHGPRRVDERRREQREQVAAVPRVARAPVQRLQPRPARARRAHRRPHAAPQLERRRRRSTEPRGREHEQLVPRVRRAHRAEESRVGDKEHKELAVEQPDRLAEPEAVVVEPDDDRARAPHVPRARRQQPAGALARRRWHRARPRLLLPFGRQAAGVGQLTLHQASQLDGPYRVPRDRASQVPRLGAEDDMHAVVERLDKPDHAQQARRERVPAGNRLRWILPRTCPRRAVARSVDAVRIDGRS